MWLVLTVYIIASCIVVPAFIMLLYIARRIQADIDREQTQYEIDEAALQQQERTVDT